MTFVDIVGVHRAGASSERLFMSNPSEINGGSALAMVGKDCVAIACDLRLGLQSVGISGNFERIFEYGSAFVALTGLATDVQTVSTELRKRHNLYNLREERELEPKTMAHLISSMLYSRRFGPWFVGPLVAGIDSKTGEPFICGFDSIGCIDLASDFVVTGTAGDQLYGMAESLYEPNLEPEQLFETTAQALMSAMDRDPLGGYGGIVYVFEKNGKVTKRLLKTRQD